MSTVPLAFAALHELKPVPFDPTALDDLLKRLIHSHCENTYSGSVKALNAAKQRLAAFLEDPDVPAFVHNNLKREHLMCTGSAVLHELYFGNLGWNGQPDPGLCEVLGKSFGSFETWEKEFRHMGARLGGGSHSTTICTAGSWKTTGNGIICTLRAPRCPSWSWTCTGIPAGWISAQARRPMSMPSSAAWIEGWFPRAWLQRFGHADLGRKE